MRFEVLMTVKMLMLVFWVATPCELVGRYHHFKGTFYLYLQDNLMDGQTRQKLIGTFLLKTQPVSYKKTLKKN
jgi:hypothetical protein